MPAQDIMRPATFPVETLVLSDFTQTANTGAGALQTILQHIVPRGEARALVRYPGRLTLGVKDSFNGTGAATTFNLSAKFTVSRNWPQPARAFVGGVEQTYTSSTTPGAGQFTVIAGSPDTVKFGTAPASGTNNVVVYYGFQAGRYSVEVFTPNERRHDSYANGSILRLNAAPQDDVNSAFAVNSTTPWLEQDYIVRVQVDAASVVNFDANNTYTQVELPFTRIPLAALKAAEMTRANGILGI